MQRQRQVILNITCRYEKTNALPVREKTRQGKTKHLSKELYMVKRFLKALKRLQPFNINMFNKTINNYNNPIIVYVNDIETAERIVQERSIPQVTQENKEPEKNTAQEQ